MEYPYKLTDDGSVYCLTVEALMLAVDCLGSPRPPVVEESNAKVLVPTSTPGVNDTNYYNTTSSNPVDYVLSNLQGKEWKSMDTVNKCALFFALLLKHNGLISTDLANNLGVKSLGQLWSSLAMRIRRSYNIDIETMVEKSWPHGIKRGVMYTPKPNASEIFKLLEENTAGEFSVPSA